MESPRGMMRMVPGILATPASLGAVAPELELDPPLLEELLLEPVVPASCWAPESAPASLAGWAPLLAEPLLPLLLPVSPVTEPSWVEASGTPAGLLDPGVDPLEDEEVVGVDPEELAL